MRAAIYFTPDRDHPLARLAAAWLGRDAFSGDAAPRLELADIPAGELARLTQDAARYGFHATLKAPFRLADGEDEASLDAAMAQFVLTAEPFEQKLVTALLDGFVALVPHGPLPELNALADDVVRAFEPFRAPLTSAEVARRNPDKLSLSERRNLDRWGYPHVFEDFRFHMTLTDRVPAPDRDRTLDAARSVFADALARPILIDGIALFVEPEPGAPFVVRSRHAFLGKERR